MAARPTYVRNETLKTIRSNYPGNKMIGAQFCNGEELYEPSLNALIRWQTTKNPQKEEKKADPWVPAVVD